MNTEELEKIIGYTFTTKIVLQESLTHRSYLNENPKWRFSHNERLEFLGDAVLELLTTEILYHSYPDDDEGKMTALRASLVNYVMLAQVARDIGLEKFLLLSRGEAKDMGRAREVIIANAIEALIGALYLDGGYPAAKSFIEKFVMTHLDEVLADGSYKDAKSSLQEKTQADQKMTPVYKVLEESGLDHRKTFVVGVFLGDKLIAEGKGLSKQDAETDAAKAALKNL
ncbi:MAG: ribonuclease III [bacterium]|nr:ribonuclease III [bacterium]